ncbi:hypothetical protein BKH41_01395 [Helicobacter sp. 12S02232-10]|uniref:hypothetical protein n=1 Tax=Helicobacter sp. 12S02232-10 TaxID=1476197 RepID=UPI000BA7B246|nr:hypothetical protein [Helicobacter sp. 12S02232-10]PAF49981.1 hypothetical protein BKH41_01395 [Helicobacter sp. 12S02232-10]
MQFDFAGICRENGFPTRIVSCSFEFEYGRPSQAAYEEYLKLGEWGSDGFENWLENLKRKNRDESENELILKVLTQIYHKLNFLESLIKQQCEEFINLDNKALAGALGHGVICSVEKSFEPSKDYYVRFKLPIFPYKHMGVFTQAFDERILKITQMHPKDIQDFDMYIANKEMENLRAQRNRKDK